MFILHLTDLSAILSAVEKSQGILPFLASVLQTLPGSDGQQLYLLLANINVGLILLQSDNGLKNMAAFPLFCQIKKKYLNFQFFNPYKSRDAQIWNEAKPTILKILTKFKTFTTIAKVLSSKHSDDAEDILSDIVDTTGYQYFL